MGMENYGIDDSQITASHEPTIEKEKYDKHSVRLHNKYSWRPDARSDSYLQVSFGMVATVTGIATQGDNEKPFWVKSYKILYSSDGNNWKYFKVLRTSRTNVSYKVLNGKAP